MPLCLEELRSGSNSKHTPRCTSTSKDLDRLYGFTVSYSQELPSIKKVTSPDSGLIPSDAPLSRRECSGIVRVVRKWRDAGIAISCISVT